MAIDMNLVRASEQLKMNSATTLGKAPTEAEIKHAQKICNESNSQTIQPSLNWLINNFDEISLASTNRELAEIHDKATAPAKSTREDIQVTLKKGTQVLSFTINDYEANKQIDAVTVDLKSVQPPVPGLIRIFNNTLGEAYVKIDPSQSDKLHSAIQTEKNKPEQQTPPSSRSVLPWLWKLFGQDLSSR